MKKDITALIVTFKTNKKILEKCLKSINKDIKILIIENSKKFENKDFFLKKFKNLRIYCTGSNLGYGKGNNYGLKKVKTKHAIILNPDAHCSKNFFKNLDNNFKKIKNFHLIGCSYIKKNHTFPAGFFDEKKNKKFEKNINTKKVKEITKVDWIRGFCIIVNLEKFRKRDIFDRNYFLFFEEIDLCKSIQRKNGNVYFIKNLKINHLGFKGSIGSAKIEKIRAENLRNWHFMWSSFYFYKKNFNYFHALKKMFRKFLSSLIKTIFYALTFQYSKRNKYLYRFLGIFNSMIGRSSFFKIEN